MGSEADKTLLKTGTPYVKLSYYNHLNQLVKVSTDKGVFKYGYNDKGLRISKTGPSGTMSYFWDGDKLIAEYKEGFGLKATYLYGVGGSQIHRKDALSGKIHYYFHNAHGDVTALTDGSGNVSTLYDYNAYGEVNVRGENIENPFKYFGQYYDEETGSYYLRARYYDPSMMRFTNEDTYQGKGEDPLSLNRYLYCVGNPVINMDSSGHMPVYALRGVSSLYNRGVFDAQATSTFTLIANGYGAYTAFHEIAQLNIARVLTELGYESILEYSITSKEIKNRNGKYSKYEADIVSGNMVWEVKPLGTSGKAQLMKYMDDGDLNAGMMLEQIRDIPIFGEYKMGIAFNSPGIASYYFYKVNEKGQIIMVPTVEVKSEYDKRATAAIIATSSIIAITLAEDIITGGVGVADDIPSTLGALELAGVILAH